MRGWRVNVDRSNWVPSRMRATSLRSNDYGPHTRGMVADFLEAASGESNSSIPPQPSFHYTQSFPCVGNLRPASRTKLSIHNDGQQLLVLEGQTSKHSPSTSISVHEECLLKSRSRKARKEMLHQANERRYLELHNKLNTDQMSLGGVRTKFGRKRYTLVGAITTLERKQAEALVDEFAGIGL